MISAVSGSTTVKPKTPRNSGGHTLLLAASRSSADTPIRITGAIAKMSARLRPMVARSVSRRTTGLSTPDMGFTALFLAAQPRPRRCTA